jgi:hypothetical protein
VRRLDFAAEGAQVGVSHIIEKNNNDVRLFGPEVEPATEQCAEKKHLGECHREGGGLMRLKDC